MLAVRQENLRRLSMCLKVAFEKDMNSELRTFLYHQKIARSLVMAVSVWSQNSDQNDVISQRVETDTECSFASGI
jgi:hypothetical protein